MKLIYSHRPAVASHSSAFSGEQSNKEIVISEASSRARKVATLDLTWQAVKIIGRSDEVEILSRKVDQECNQHSPSFPSLSDIPISFLLTSKKRQATERDDFCWGNGYGDDFCRVVSPGTIPILFSTPIPLSDHSSSGGIPSLLPPPSFLVHSPLIPHHPLLWSTTL